MHAVARPNHLGHVPTVAARGSRIPSLAGVVTVISAAVAVALVIAFIVAATLGLGADGRPGIGPDRPPMPMIVPRTLV
jgi:hypothetical protein